MKNILQILSPIARTDSYKLSQYLQYPADTAYVSSYIESRGGEEESVFFGIQAFIKDYMMTPITRKDIDFCEKVAIAHGEPFNKAGWEIILNEYDGYLPLEIEAVPEGTVMATKNVQVQVINTDPRLAWLVSYVETAMLRGVWYPSTVATKSRKLKKVISKALEKTSDLPVSLSLPFKLHDFGARGASSTETAVLGGMAHLINFKGTDNFESVVGAMQYYNATEVCGFSIPASEHSTITSWGRAEESKAYENIIDQFAGEGKVYACVSDSYNIYNAVENIWGKELRDKVINSGGTLVVRPDSGDPLTVPITITNLLMKQFGYTVNSKGYKVLPDCVRVIQGDGINENSLEVLINNMIDAGLSIDNIAFGMGGGLLQAWDRDTLKYAMKASARCDSNGEWMDVYKDPIDDKGKLSKKGRLGLVSIIDGFKTVSKKEADELRLNKLRVIYRNGKLLEEDTMEDIRLRASLGV